MREPIMEQLIERLTPHRDKLLLQLKKRGITFQHDDGLGNVVFTCKGKEARISHTIFYRYSGLACTRKDIKGENGQGTEFTLLPVTDDMFMNTHMRLVLTDLIFAEQLKTI